VFLRCSNNKKSTSWRKFHSKWNSTIKQRFSTHSQKRKFQKQNSI